MRRPPGEAALIRVRTMRHEAPEPERRLWSIVRSGRIASAKIRRQVWLGPYIADFVCLAARLVIEVDGDTHSASFEADAERTAWLQREGFRVIRFTNAEVVGNPEGVAEAIRNALTLPPPDGRRAPPSPLQGEGS